MNKWTPKNGKSDYENFHPGERLFTDDYEQFCYELALLLESWDVNIVANCNEINIIFPRLTSFGGGVIRDLSIHKEKCMAITGHAARLFRMSEEKYNPANTADPKNQGG